MKIILNDKKREVEIITTTLKKVIANLLSDVMEPKNSPTIIIIQ